MHLSLLDPIPHQIQAVYWELLPRQPLRFALCDDPGAWPQLASARTVDRQRFIGALHAQLPKAIRKLQEGAIPSIDDLGQAVRSALELIGQVQGEVLDEFVGNLDRHTRWAMAWYRDHGFDEGAFDEAEKLSKTTNTSVDGLVASGIARARGGKVALLARTELAEGWDPDDDRVVTVWEVAQHLVKRLISTGGEQAAAALLRQCRRWADEARNLAYWLSVTAAGQGRAKDAFDYDALVTSWPELARLAERVQQEELAVDG